MSPTEANVPADLYVRALGGFAAITSNGRSLELPKKAQALLCFLIAHRGRTVSRGSLAGLLWSNGTSWQSRQSLRQCLTTLRGRLPGNALSALVIAADSLKLVKSGHLRTDIEDFERLTSASTLTCLNEANDLYGGPLLHGVFVRSEPFDDWLIVERERLGRLRLDLYERLARATLNGGDLKAALRHAHALVSEDPLRDESARLLMEILYAGGQRSSALLEYANLKRRLRDELRIDPEPMTAALAERIRRNVSNISAVSIHRSEPKTSSQARPSRRTRRNSGEPRVAVLPFKNWTGQGNADALGSVLAEDVWSALACDRILQVEVFGRELDVAIATFIDLPDYVVTGSVREIGARTSVAIQLVCGRTRRCLWSNRFDIRNVSTGNQDKLPLSIAAQLSFAIRLTETRRARSVPFEDLSVVQLALVSAAMSRKDKSHNATAVSMLVKAIDTEPELGMLHGVVSRCFHVQRLMGWLSPTDTRLARGLEHARQASELSSDDSEALWMAGLAFMNIGGDLTEARRLVDRSLILNKSSVNAHLAACFLECQRGRADTAIEHARTAYDLNPGDTSHHVQKSAAATALFVAGRYEAADTACDASLLQRPGYAAALRLKIATASMLGRKAEAESAAQQLLEREPKASVSRMRDYWKWLAPNAPDALDAKLEGWRRAGMPE